MPFSLFNFGALLPNIDLGTFTPLIIWPLYGLFLIYSTIASGLGLLLLP
jgi:hypothetical protein